MKKQFNNMRQLKITKTITPRDESSIDKYLQEIKKFDLLNYEQEVELAQKIKQGDKKSLEKLTKSNLRFVVSVAKQFQNQGLDFPDLINEGNLGLIRAAEKYDETKGFKFISYAVWWVRQSIRQAIRKKSRIIKIPENKLDEMRDISQGYERLEKIGEDYTYSKEEAKLLSYDEKIKSLDYPLHDDKDTLGEKMENPDSPLPDQNSQKESLRKDLENLINQIQNEDKREIIKMHYFEEKNFKEIANEKNLTYERVRQIHKSTIIWLKRLAPKHYQDYL